MNLFRKSLLLIFCLRLLLSSETVAELFKLPFLVSHYLHHQHTEGHCHILDFLQEHYGSKHHHDQDEREHQTHHQLPFGGHHSAGLKGPVQPFLNVSGLKFPPVSWQVLSTDLPTSLVEQWHSQFSPSIWQPPKIG